MNPDAAIVKCVTSRIGLGIARWLAASCCVVIIRDD